MRLTASAVAMNVFAGTITSSAALTPATRSANSSASVPLATPTTCPTPICRAYACSNPSTAAPPMNAALSKTS